MRRWIHGHRNDEFLNCNIPQSFNGGCSLPVRNEGTCTTSYDEVSRISNHPPLPTWVWSATCTDSPCFSITLCNSDTIRSLWGLVYFYISSGMPLNTGISGDISFINSWTFIHFHLYIVVIECFWDISTRYDNYVAHQHIHHLHGEQMNLIKDTWHTRHTPYPQGCPLTRNPCTTLQGGIPPCL